MSRRDETDVVVIGSGAGGAPAAYALARAGLRVVMLEKGPHHRLRDFVHDEIAVTRRDFFVPYADDDPHTLKMHGSDHAERTREGWISQCVGGGTVHMMGLLYRLNEQDFRLRTLTGGVEGADLADWPITYDELRRYYDLADALVGLSGQAGTNPFESPRAAYPMPPLAAHAAAALVDEAAKKLGYHPYPTPRAIVSQAYGARPPCNQCGFCVEYGCESSAKSSTLATLIPAALATGRMELRALAMATRLVTGDDGRVSGVEYVDAQGSHLLRARVVVLAAGAIESARLLLLSASGGAPHGLANASGLVGKHLTFSTHGKGTAVFDRHAVAAKVGEAGMHLPFIQRSMQDDYWLGEKGGAFGKGGTHNFLLPPPGPINAASRLAIESGFTLIGDALRERVVRYFKDELWIEFETFSEFLPTAKTYVELDPEVKDRHGLPVARIHLGRHPYDELASRTLVERGNAVLSAMLPKAESVVTGAKGLASFHLQHGTCRFGDDPTRSVLDRDCRAHDVDNLYVTDSSFMPTSGSVPATLTIMANSLRVAERIRARLVERG